MIDVEQIKKDGMIQALKDRITSLKFSIVGGPLWASYIENGYFCKLEESIRYNREILDEMEEVFNALREIEPENK
jgi:hypothetical protein